MTLRSCIYSITFDWICTCDRQTEKSFSSLMLRSEIVASMAYRAPISVLIDSFLAFFS